MSGRKDASSTVELRTTHKSRSAVGVRRVGISGQLLVVLFGSLYCIGRVAAEPVAFGPGAEEHADAKTVFAGSVADMQATLKQVDVSRRNIVVQVGVSSIMDLTFAPRRLAVATEEIAEVKVISPRQILVTGRAVGKTQIILWNEDEEQLVFAVSVEPDLTILRETIRKIAPTARVDVQAVGDTVILTGQVGEVEDAERITQIAEIIVPKIKNQINVAGQQQVLLRCTFAEVDKRSTRQLGVNSWMAGDHTRDFFFVNQIGGINPVNIGAGPTGNIRNGLVFATDTAGLPLTATPDFSFGFTKMQIQFFLRALRQNNLLRVLAEPNLVALNGQQAEFLAGGEFPIPVAQGNGAVGVEYKDYGIILTFVPTVIGRHKIRLLVGTEVSALDSSVSVALTGFSVPGLTKRRAGTTIEMASGSTIAIAGLLSEEIRGMSQRIPGLGDIPVLGALFSSVEYQRSLTELVVLVTPELVGAMHPDQVPSVPGEHMTEPDDFELFGLQMLEGRPVADLADPEQALEDEPPSFRRFTCSPEQMSLHGPWGIADAAETVQ
ncbi:MAG: type II and III secretion system protein family protein [Phycisphaerales bacterium]|nr:type II and III secretion system protein family protein [Phycisphaerales bacterium]